MCIKKAGSGKVKGNDNYYSINKEKKILLPN